MTLSAGISPKGAVKNGRRDERLEVTIFGAPRGDLPKKRRGVRIGERKYATICNTFPFFVTSDRLVSCTQVLGNKRVMPFYGRVVSVGFFSFLNRRSLVQFQSGEVCNMRVCDITDRSKEVWLFCPQKHKNSWRHHKKAVALGKPVQEILERRMIDKSPDDYIFTPAEAMQERNAKKRANRKSKITPSQTARDKARAANPKRKFLECYTSESYGNSIDHAIKTANKRLPDGEKIESWSPYRLRHTKVSQTVLETGSVDIARAVEEFEQGKALFLGSTPEKAKKILEVLGSFYRSMKQGDLSEAEYNMKKSDLLSGKLVA